MYFKLIYKFFSNNLIYKKKKLILEKENKLITLKLIKFFLDKI
jgi:hypothetical protein